jgi:DNA polymerase elongation subunit (family B)
MDSLKALLSSLAAPEPKIEEGKIKVWLMSVQVLQKLQTSEEAVEQGPFVLLTCKTKDGATLTLIIKDWMPWFRVLGSSSKVLEPVLKFRHRSIKSISPETPRAKACGWESTSSGDFSTRLFPSVRITVTHLYASQYVQQNLREQVSGFGDATGAAADLEFTDTVQRPANRFLNDLNLRTSSWIQVKLPRGLERAQLTIGWEARCRSVDISQTADLAQDLSAPPLRMASFDGEMSSSSRRFPSPHVGDRIFCMSTTLNIYQPPKPSQFITVTLYLHPLRANTSLQRDNHLLVFFKNYRDLLEAWAFVLREFDCDIGPTGWNIEAFDWPFFAQSYTQLFDKPAQRGAEGLHLEIWRLLKQPQPSVRELLARLGNSQLKDLRSRAAKELPNHQALLDKLTGERKDSSMVLEEEEDEEEELSQEESYLPAIVHLTLRTHLNSILGLAAPPSWEPSRELFQGLYTKFGGDAARLMMNPPEQGPKQGMFLSRLKFKECKIETRQMSTAAKGDNVREIVSRDGPVGFDAMTKYKDSEHPQSISLKAAAEANLQGISKLDMPIDELFQVYDDTRALRVGEEDKEAVNFEQVLRVADYCARDAEVPLRLLEHFKYLEGWIGLSRVCNLPLDGVVNGGQQARVFAELSWGTRHSHLLNAPETGWPQDLTKYQGATVMDPIPGFYVDSPLSTLDFASLYPSIMSAYNLCPSTLVRNPKIAAELRAKGMCMDFPIDHVDSKGQAFTRTYTFASHVPSVLSQLLQGLLSQRKATKKLMETEEDPVRKEILNKMQLAYKVVCNSAYGYCGSTAGSIWGPFFPVAAVTTFGGRSLIASTKHFIEQTFEHPLQKGKRPRVVYGDTDSVMIEWPSGTSLEQAFWLGEQASKDVTSFLRSKLLDIQQAAKGFGRDPSEMVKVLKLEHEKEMWPALMCLQKKNYAYRCWTPKTVDVASQSVTFKVVTNIKGLQCVRRDAVPYYAKLMLRVLDFLLLERNPAKALEDVHKTLSDLIDHRLPLEDLVVSKSVAAHYKVSQVHIEARKRMEARGEEIPPIGGRMPFIITAPKRGLVQSVTERSEHPEWVAKQALKPDIAYYLKSSFSALRKLYQSFDTDKLEAILGSCMARATNQNSKRLLDQGEQDLQQVLDSGTAAPKKRKEEKKTRALF